MTSRTSKKAPTKDTKDTKVTTVVSNLDLADMKEGDIFSEISHYVYTGNQYGKTYALKHLGSGEEVTLSEAYITELLKTADQYMREEKVGREDKLWTEKQIEEARKSLACHIGGVKVEHLRVGDVRVKGIRSVWEEIHSQQVFTVCFNTQDSEMTNKEFEALREAQLIEAIEDIEKAAKSKKGVAGVATRAIARIQENPISKIVKGKERVLRGYKVQFVSRDGKYNCVDMDITDKHNVRPVNINTINWLVYDGIKYIVE